MSAPPSAASPRPPQRLLPCSAAPSLPPLRRPSAKADPSAKAAQLPAPTSFAPPLSSAPPLRPFSPSCSSLAAPLLLPSPRCSPPHAGAALIGAKLVGAGRLRRPSRRSASPPFSLLAPLWPPRSSPPHAGAALISAKLVGAGRLRRPFPPAMPAPRSSRAAAAPALRIHFCRRLFVFCRRVCYLCRKYNP